MRKQDASVEVRRSGQAGDRYHRLGLGGDKEPLGLSDLILHHAEVQGLHPISSIGWVPEIKQADKVVLEDLAVRRTGVDPVWWTPKMRALPSRWESDATPPT